MFDIKAEVKKLPLKPGVYIMKDFNDNILYIGKALILKRRVSQYFRNSSNLSPRISKMVSLVRRFEYIVTGSETEALILECNLIKQHMPPYNVLLKDDKNFPYIKVTVNEEYPRILITRRILKDGAKYYGPYTDASAVKETVALLTKIFQLRLCNKDLPIESGKHRPCLNFHIDQCLAPCAKNITSEEYRKIIDEACKFIEGKQQEIIDKIESQMKEAAENREYEKAALLRDKIIAANKLAQKQSVTSGDSEADMDIIGLARGANDACTQVFFVRNGKITGRENFMFKDVAGVEDEEIISSFLKQFYLWVSHIPAKILLDNEIQDIEAIQKWLTDKRGRKVEIKVPQKGENRNLLEIARRNAEVELQRRGIGYEAALLQLKQVAGLEFVPKRIEAYDISNLSGSAVVGCMVVFDETGMDKSQYKRFKIETVAGQDDVGCIKEVISRRLRRAVNSNNEDEKSKGFKRLPELMLIDGGTNQLNAAVEAAANLNIHLPTIGMVKDKKHKTRGLVLQSGIEIDLKKHPQIMKLVSEIQEEVHRFTVEYHRKLRKKESIASIIDEIEGIGTTRKKELFRHFGSIEEIKKASIEELLKVRNINAKTAQNIYYYFH